jgi:hypothetical protein
MRKGMFEPQQQILETLRNPEALWHQGKAGRFVLRPQLDVWVKYAEGEAMEEGKLHVLSLSWVG